MGSLGESHSWL